MSDKARNFPAPTTKASKTKRPSTVSVASSSRQPSTVSVASSSRHKTVIPSTTIKEKLPARPKFNRNTTILGGDADTTILKLEGMPDFDSEYRQMAYGNFLRAMLEECLIDEKIEREENQMDIQMAQLADRFQKTVDVLDKTNRRLKDVSFVIEQKRLLDMKSRDCARFYETTDTSNIQDIIQNLSKTEQTCLDKLETKNIDFGYDKDSGHKQLLDAVNDTIDGLEQVKIHSKLDMHKFKEFEKSQENFEELDKDRLNFESLKTDFEAKFPKFNEKLLKEASEKIAKMIENEED